MAYKGLIPTVEVKRGQMLYQGQVAMSVGAQDVVWNSWTLYDTAEGSLHKSHKEDIPGQEDSTRETRVINSKGAVYIRWVLFKKESSF